MADYTNTIPKDLPITDPLLFSFLMIMDVVDFNIRMNGMESRKSDIVPVFEYAVNSWRTIVPRENYNRDAEYRTELDVICAIWKNKPDHKDNVTWSNYPSGPRADSNKKDIIIGDKYSFEAWKQRTYKELTQIVELLVRRGPKRDTDAIGNPEVKYLPDIFGWEILNDQVRYVYAQDKTSDQFYGVGATFTLRGDYYDCCPEIDKTNLSLSLFESRGFQFPQ